MASLALGSNGFHHLRAAGWDGTGHSEKVSANSLPTPALLFTSVESVTGPKPTPAPHTPSHT